MRRARLLIYGRVQGVYFRQGTRETAERHGVTGWVRNLPDGSVEVLLEGGEKEVEKVVEWCRHGPPAARVDRLEVEWGEPSGEFHDFSLRYT